MDSYGRFLKVVLWNVLKRADLTGTNLCASHLACASHVRLSIYGISVSSVFVFLGRQLQAPKLIRRPFFRILHTGEWAPPLSSNIIKKWENLNENDGTYQITNDIREKIAQQVGLASFKCFPCFPLGFDDDCTYWWQLWPKPRSADAVALHARPIPPHALPHCGTPHPQWTTLNNNMILSLIIKTYPISYKIISSYIIIYHHISSNQIKSIQI